MPSRTATRYLCLSDLHLGAAYSTLTATDAQDRPAPDQPSDTLVALGHGLRELLAAMGDGPPPTLVLLGDVLDMGLSPMGDVAHAFRCFVDNVMLDAQGQPLFAPRVLCVPGNHDHHLWRVAQDSHYQMRLSQGRIHQNLIQHTRLAPFEGPDAIGSPMLTSLMRSVPALADAGVRCDIVYPNLGLFDAAGRRGVVLHHGHYVDPMYRVVSMINAQAGPTGRLELPATLSVEQIEAQNGAWVDFLWSNLGASGRTGDTVTTLYEVMRDAGASHEFTRRLADLLVGKIGETFGTAGTAVVAKGLTVGQVVLGALDATLGRGAESQRDSYAETMSASDVADLRWYLSEPLHLQMRREGYTALRELDLTFVFGHTHKPFEDELPVKGFDRPVSVFNTGGWVMDQPTMARTQGAAAVFIDDALNVASLRLFNDPVNGLMAPVSAHGVGGFRDRDNPMLAALADALARTGPAWQAFSDCARAATERRATQLLDRFFEPPAPPTLPPPVGTTVDTSSLGAKGVAA